MILHYVSLGIVSAMAMLLLCIIINHNETLNRKMKMFFTLAIIGIIIVTLAEVASYYYAKPNTDFRLQRIICCEIIFCVSPFITLFITLAFCKLALNVIVIWFLPAIVNLFLTLLSPFFGFIFYVSANNVYSRGPFYGLFMLSIMLGGVLLIFETVNSDKRYQSKNGHILYLILLFMVIGVTIQILLPMVHTIWICVALSTSFYYSYFCELSEKYDAQTFLFNRRAYECELERIEDAAHAYILLFDIDDFKIINDTYGHQYGDECLYKVACCIKDTFQSLGLCFRIGGDEFCVVSKNIEEKIIIDAKKDFKKKLLECMEKDKRLPKVSLGCGYYKKGFCQVSEAVRLADEQLYAAKNVKKFV
ncbi:putative diguanylate cyclase YeaJ [Anaerotignum neopropionicum]|uniref:Putative diguanylate cyclase YeaJ n=1 Tax=Anaerotignum neopropionicum TaxID=36847 RepID=A0A136WHX7_9FIRM|nr:GGDEF domain-containing protein [Anaerotignum neopropionicum]KXL54145.1 putative diguanylate cyclase YeaJ [Anaerotignum neopropionicum]